MILIHVLILLPQLQQLLEHLHSLRLQLPGVHQLLVVLPPRAHVAFLRHKLGGFAVVNTTKGQYLSTSPSLLILILKLRPRRHTSTGYAGSC